MDQFAQAMAIFASLSTLLLCIGIFIFTFMVRRVVETGWPGVKTNKWWTDVWLPFFPALVGVLAAFIAKGYIWPESVASNNWARALYGLSCGVACGWVYARFKGVINASVASKLASITGSTNPIEVVTPPVDVIVAQPDPAVAPPAADKPVIDEAAKTPVL